MNVISGAEGQFTNKLLVDISGTIKGYVKNVDIEMSEGKILIHMKLGQTAETYGLSRSEAKLLRFETKITMVADEIVSVGKDCIIISKGKLPPLEEIKKAKMYKAENDSLKIKLNEVNDELENSLRKLKVLKEDKSELESKLSTMHKMEEDFNELRFKCAKLEGELEASKRFIKKDEGFKEDETPESLPESSEIIGSEFPFQSFENEIEETLDEEKQNKFDDIMEDFALFGEEENLEGEEETSSDYCSDDAEREETSNLSKENPFKRFSKEYRKEDYE